MPLGRLMSPDRREQRHGLGHRGAIRSFRCSRVMARKRESPMSITRRRATAATDEDSARSIGSRRVRTWRRVGRGALVVAAGTAALALAGPLALRPFVDAAGAAGAAGDVTVAFVIDFGPGTTPVVGCVDVPPTDNGYDALAAFASQEGIDQPTYNPSGLLCSINCIPSSGCGQVVAGGYIYWSYFTGAKGGWTYAIVGCVRPGHRGRRPGVAVPESRQRAIPTTRSALSRPLQLHLWFGHGDTATAQSGGSSSAKVRQSRARPVAATPDGRPRDRRPGGPPVDSRQHDHRPSVPDHHHPIRRSRRPRCRASRCQPTRRRAWTRPSTRRVAADPAPTR